MQRNMADSNHAAVGVAQHRSRARRWPVWRVWLLGALTPPILGTALVAATVKHWPDVGGLLTVARLTENLVPHLLVLSLIGAGVLGLIGGWRAAGLTVAVVAMGAALSVKAHHSRVRALAPETPVALRLLWFNVWHANETPPAQLIAALADSPADIVILGEAAPLQPHLDALAVHFPVQMGCRAERCELLILSRRPLQSMQMHEIGSLRPERLAVLKDETAEGPLTVVAMHWVKPWFFGFAEVDEWFALGTVQANPGPLVMVGDFNAAPWSARLRKLNSYCKLSAPWPPVATWPTAAGPLGVPIDLALTRGGAVVVSQQPWGADLGSNHRGLLLEIGIRDIGTSLPCWRTVAPLPDPAPVRPPPGGAAPS